MTYPIIIKLISPLSLYYICNVCIYSCFFSRNIRKLHYGFLVSLPKEEKSQDEKNGSSRMGRNIAVFVFHAHRRQKKGVQSKGYCPPTPPHYPSNAISYIFILCPISNGICSTNFSISVSAPPWWISLCIPENG